jgi:hypothetical protein
VGLSLPVRLAAHARVTFDVRDETEHLACLQDASGEFGEVGAYAAALPGDRRYAVAVAETVAVKDDGSFVDPASTETKGTGANMVPLEKLQESADDEPRRAPRQAQSARERRPSGMSQATGGQQKRTSQKPVRTTATPLPPGHVRKKTTGEIGKVRSVDPNAGTAVVYWLRRGDA